MHICATLCPNLRALIVRKTRESVTESALVTFEEHVLPAGHSALDGPQRRMRQAYHYPNGSEIVVGGLDKPGKIMSTEYDLAYVQEAIELTEDAWEALTTRLRNGAMPYQQIIADTNPDKPTHWLKRRCDAGRSLMLESRHEDNPRLYVGGWTVEGASYLSRLEALTGPRYQRLRMGRWVQAEGVVYEGWDAATHLIDRFPVPPEWRRYWAVDFGFTNPFVCQWWAQDPDGRLYRYREIYRTQTLVEDHARAMLAASGWHHKAGFEGPPAGGEPRPVAVICDHDAEDRATLERHLGMKTVPAWKGVSDGIQAVAARLRPAADGRPRLFLMRDSLVGRDARRDEAKKPCDTAEEIDGYVWNVGGGRRKGEEPVKEDDHGCDALRYVVAYLDAQPRRKLQVW